MGIKVKTQSKKVNKAWLNEHVNDHYVRLAQKEGFRARAAYKLKEIDETLGLIRPGDVVTFRAPNGGQYSGIFKQWGDGWALFDFNHPLAGTALRLDVTLLGVL